MTEPVVESGVNVEEIRARWQQITNDHADGRAGPTAKLVFLLLDEIERLTEHVANCPMLATAVEDLDFVQPWNVEHSNGGVDDG